MAKMQLRELEQKAEHELQDSRTALEAKGTEMALMQRELEASQQALKLSEIECEQQSETVKSLDAELGEFKKLSETFGAILMTSTASCGDEGDGKAAAVSSFPAQLQCRQLQPVLFWVERQRLKPQYRPQFLFRY